MSLLGVKGQITLSKSRTKSLKREQRRVMWMITVDDVLRKQSCGILPETKLCFFFHMNIKYFALNHLNVQRLPESDAKSNCTLKQPPLLNISYSYSCLALSALTLLNFAN